VSGRRLISAALALALAGCAVGPDYRPLETPVPKAFGHGGEPGSERGGKVDAAWWTLFGDPLLTRLVETAVAGNPNLEQARLRVLEARALRQEAASYRLPTVNANVDYQKVQISGNGPFFPEVPGVIDRGPANLFQTGFDASWELDLWGRIRRTVESAEAELEATEARRRDVLLTVVGEVARNYVELRGHQQLAAITRRNAGIQQELLDLTTTLAQSGLATDVEVARARARVEATRADLPGHEAAATAAIHRIAVLTGQEPTAWLNRLGREGPVPDVPRTIAAGLPAELVRRRPDIRAAEREVAAATARIGAATAELFPRVSLSGNFAMSSKELATLFNGDSTLFGVGPKIVWPLFNAGRLDAAIDARAAEQRAAAARYRQTVLRALEETETSLSNLGQSLAARDLRAASEAASQDAVRLADMRYGHGLENFLSVLDAQRDAYEAESALVQSRIQVASNLVALFKALGGGWETFEPKTPGEASKVLAKAGENPS
jgi:multidrug efflux system outer membrane protein